LGIECEWCAYCLDEALYLADSLYQREREREVTAEAERAEAVEAMRREMRTG
jgi:biotin synthase-like enzyme